MENACCMKLVLSSAIFLISIPSVVDALSNAGIQYRQGTSADEVPIALQIARELMNPLGIVGERFVVAQDENRNSRRIGWAQIRPLPGTKRRDPNQYDARPGSYSPRKEADDAAWEAFENDETAKIPVGMQSLPWTKQYRDFAMSAKRRREAKEATSSNDGGVDDDDNQKLYELASVWVDPDYRKQGIGTELVRRVIQRHVKDQGHLAEDLYLLTLASTSGWYRENFGFRLVTRKNEIPQQMAFEVAAGSFITKAIGAELVCMRCGGLKT